MADIVLIYPRTGLDLGWATIAPPHSLLTIAAPLHREGYEVRILDQRTSRHWKRQLILELKLNPVCVGISAMTGTNIKFAVEAAKLVREHTDGRIPIVWGGPHPSSLPLETCQSEYVDLVCIGEGDKTFEELVKAIGASRPLNNVQGIAYKDGGRVVFTQPRPLLDIETLLPIPWELINTHDYIHKDLYLKKKRTLDIGQTSRGCPFSCGFCSSAAIRQRKWRAMSIEKSLQAILEPIKRFNLNGIWIRDDEFHINRERAYGICEGIVESGLKISWYTSGARVDIFNSFSDEQIAMLKRSGAHTLKFGAESGSNRILKLISKGITTEDTIRANLRAKRFGIIPCFSFMMGFPTETLEEINQTIDFAIRLKRDNAQAQFESFSPYAPLPGTSLYSMALAFGLKPPDDLIGWSKWNYEEAGKLLWFKQKDRHSIGNLSYMWALSNAVQNLVDSIRNPFVKLFIKIISKPTGLYFWFKVKRKSYSFVPELALFKGLYFLIRNQRWH